MSNYDMNNNPQARREKRLAAEKRRKKKAALKRARIGQILFFPLMILFMEWVFHVSVLGAMSFTSFIFVMLYSFAVGWLVLYLPLSLIKKDKPRMITGIVLISVIGEVLFLISSWFVLAAIGRKIYAPLEEADRKQKNFMKNANKELRIPLTVISGNLELIERDGGPNEQTAAVRRQLGKLFELTGKLDKIGVYEEESEKEEVSLSAVLEKTLSAAESSFVLKGLSLEKNIQPDIAIQADPAGMEMLAAELIRNALKYADSWVSFSLERTKDRVILETRNDTDLPDGPADQIFDRFTTLDNAAKEDSGMGLAYVKDIVKAHKGRAAASVAEGIFTLRIAL